jgi:hypothetical protein
MAIFDAADVI